MPPSPGIEPGPAGIASCPTTRLLTDFVGKKGGGGVSEKHCFDANSRNPRGTPIPGGKSVNAWLLLDLFCRESVMSFTVSFARIEILRVDAS